MSIFYGNQSFIYFLLLLLLYPLYLLFVYLILLTEGKSWRG